MKSLRQLPTAWLTLTLCLTAAPAMAEVAGLDPAFSGGFTSSQPAIFGVIGDDPDPTGAVWARYHADNNLYTVLNDQGETNGDGPPSITMDENGLFPVVFWAKQVAGQFDVVYSTMQNGQWVVPVSVSANPVKNELDPNILFDPIGLTFHLFYWTDGTIPKVWHRTAPADLSSWSSAVMVSSPSEAAVRPAGGLHEGDLYVTYEVHTQGNGQTPREIVLSKLENGQFIPEVVAITQHDGEVRPMPHSAEGRFWLDWVDSSNEGAWSERDAVTGLWNPIGYQPYIGPGERDYHLRGAIKNQTLP